MFENIAKTKKEKINTSKAILAINNKEFTVKAYDVDMNTGSIVGFIEDSDLTIDSYTRYMITIPISIEESILLTENRYNWAFPVMVVRIDEDTLKFYTPGMG